MAGVTAAAERVSADREDGMRRPVRLVLVLGTSAGGVGRHVRTVAAGLHGSGAVVRVLGPAGTAQTFGFAATGASFEPVDLGDRPRPVRDLAAVARLRRLVRGADVVHAHGLRAGAFAALALRSGPGRIRPGRRPPRLVVTLHNAAPAGGRARAVHAVLERIVARRADVVLGVSADLLDRMLALGARRVELAVVPAPPLPAPRSGARAAVRAEWGAGERPVVLAAGRLAPQKAFDVLLDAAAMLARRPGPPLVVIAGAGPLEGRLRARIAAEGLPVRLLGHRDDLADLIAAADAGAVPSQWEGQPLVLQEFLRAGLPAVVTRTGGMPGMVADAALVVPPGDPAALAAALGRLLGEPGLAARLRRAAAERGAALPGEPEAVAAVRTLYRSLAEVGSDAG